MAADNWLLEAAMRRRQEEQMAKPPTEHPDDSHLTGMGKKHRKWGKPLATETAVRQCEFRYGETSKAA